MQVTSLPQGGKAYQAMTEHEGPIFALQGAISTCQKQGGGVVAMVGAPGTGKTVLAKQFAARTSEAVYLDGITHDGCRKVTPELAGIPVLDEVWQFDGIAQAIKDHVIKGRGTVVALACSESEVRELCGDLPCVVVRLPHWANHLSVVGQDEGDRAQCAEPGPQDQYPKRSGIIRFRGPNEESWTGFGRTPKWLVALEAIGKSREQFRVDNTPLTRKGRGY